MKDKILNALKSKTFFALAINIVIMALIIGVTAFSYDSADDFYNSLYICQYHNYYNNDINYIFATITGSLQYILLNFNCFVLFQILLSCAAFSSVTFVFVDKFGKHKAFIFTLVLNILFSFDHYSNILSSKTAALLLTAGFLMALNAIRNKRYSLPFWIGVLEVIFGTFLCFKYFFVGLAFFIAFFIGDMIAKRKYKLPFRKFFWYFRPFVLVFVFIVLVGCGLEYYSYSVNNANAETSGLYRYSVLADKTDDNAFPNYSDYCEELNSVGINSANEYELFVDGYYDENNGWIYRWDVAHRISDLITLMGGKEQFIANLDRTFSEPLGRSKYEFYAQLPDHTGNVGQFSMANEPSLHVPYLYNYAGQPWKTQKRIRQMLKTWFRNDLMGMPGDEDGGGMTSFVVFSSLGFYPVTPGAPVYNIGSPLFTHAEITLSNGSVFEIEAPNVSEENKYIQSATLNGQKWEKPWFHHDDLKNGGKLVLTMGNKPNKTWGSGANAAPPSADDK